MEDLKKLLKTREIREINKVFGNKLKIDSYLDFDSKDEGANEKKVLFDYLPETQFNQEEFMKNQVILMENIYEKYYYISLII